MQLPVYLDYNATTPCDRRVLDAMFPYFSEKFGNAASRHHFYGWQAEEAVQIAREQVARLIGAEPKEIVFTSGATEACNLAIKGVFETYAGKGHHIITTAVEHKAVLDTCKYLEKKGAEVTYLPVSNEGLIDVGQLKQAIRPETILIAVMLANNETGTVMPVAAVAEVAREHNILFMSDATQGVGKLPVTVNDAGVSLMAMSAHKMYGPKGIGALYIRRRNPRVSLTPLIHGGGHENGWRSGTLNVPAIVGFGKACEIAADELANTHATAKLRNRLEAGLLQIEGAQVNGSIMHRLPNVSNIAFTYLDGDALMTGLKREIAIASGSACTSASIEPSYVLKAIGLSDEMAHGSLRFSTGRYTTSQEVDYAIAAVTRKVNELREMNPVWQMYKRGVNLAGE